MDPEVVISLPRGGVVVKTPAGNVQVGMPPETVKDCMKMKMQMPNIYVVPSTRFDTKNFVNVCEFEFPAYFNFFVTRKRIKLICSEEEQHQLEIVFQETLLGPESFPNFKAEFGDNVSEGYIPKFKEELKTMAVNPFTGEDLKVSTLLEFINYNENGSAFIDEEQSKKGLLTP